MTDSRVGRRGGVAGASVSLCVAIVAGAACRPADEAKGPASDALAVAPTDASTDAATSIPDGSSAQPGTGPDAQPNTGAVAQPDAGPASQPGAARPEPTSLVEAGTGDAAADSNHQPLTPDASACTCEPPNARGECRQGACVLLACLPGFGDCDDHFGNGCETTLTGQDNCGACGQRCEVPNATATCERGLCRLELCEPGWLNCDGNEQNGCEVLLASDMSCSACPGLCTLEERCVAGTCVPMPCPAGWVDCDGNPVNGCEHAMDSGPC